jgi:hypothetical protein
MLSTVVLQWPTPSIQRMISRINGTPNNHAMIYPTIMQLLSCHAESTLASSRRQLRCHPWPGAIIRERHGLA